MPWVLIFRDRGVSASISLCPKSALPQLYSIDVKLPEFFRILARQFFDRCSNRANPVIADWLLQFWTIEFNLIAAHDGQVFKME